MGKKELLEQNLNIFVENYIADLLHYYFKNDIADLISQKKELSVKLNQMNQNGTFLEYEEINNAILHSVAELFYKSGFEDAVNLRKKL